MTKKQTEFIPDADWRANATTLAKDIPPEGDAPGHRKGATARVCYPILMNNQMLLTTKIVPVSLMLSVAKRMKVAADDLRPEIDLDLSATGKKVSLEVLPNELESALFDLYEHLMACVVFSYSAIEAFANMWLEPEDEYEVQTKQGICKMCGSDVARRTDLTTKLQYVLPSIFKKNPPRKGQQLWQKFRTLQKLRDSIIHFKQFDLDNQARQKRKQEVRNNLFTSLLQAQVLDPPAVAHLVMKKYLPNEVTKKIYPPYGIPRWISEFGT